MVVVVVVVVIVVVVEVVVVVVVVVVGSQLLATVSFHGTVCEVFMPDMYASLGKERNSETTF